MRYLHFSTSHQLLQCYVCIFVHPLCCSNVSAKKSRRRPEYHNLERFACWRKSKMNLVFWGDIFSSPHCFSLCLFSRILVLISRRLLLREGGVAGAVNALQTGRRRATKKATAYSKATVQLLSHAKHSNVLCKGWADGELRVDLSQASHLKHTQTIPLPQMLHYLHSFVCASLWYCVVRKVWLKCQD